MTDFGGFNNSEICHCTREAKWCQSYVRNLYVYTYSVHFYCFCYLIVATNAYIYLFILQYYIILQILLHVSVFLHHLQGALIMCSLKL